MNETATETLARLRTDVDEFVDYIVKNGIKDYRNGWRLKMRELQVKFRTVPTWNFYEEVDHGSRALATVIEAPFNPTCTLAGVPIDFFILDDVVMANE